jgi:hypothetical protein
MEVIGDRGKRETGLLGALGLGDKGRSVELLARERVAEPGQIRFLIGRSVAPASYPKYNPANERRPAALMLR